tara:strand:- start:3701 stop:4987 length:1287 start_codon:yes stop_codon:yes gene_type:complete
MAVIRPPITSDLNLDSWMNQVTQEINLQAATSTTYSAVTEQNFSTIFKGKLEGVEPFADITDTSNVTAAGALMDSEVVNLAQVKAFDSADYATADDGSKAKNALLRTGGNMTGAITTNSTFDGRVVSTDGAKLDDIEALADVTDVTNVTAAGALMDSELTDIVSVKALDQGVATTDSPTFVNVTADTIQLTGGTGNQGLVSWNADEETLDLVNNGAVLQMGQEMHVHARNNTGVTIAEGVPVMANGTIGASGRILITPMVGSVQANAKYLIGITTEEIASGSDGKATQFGKVRGIDTTGTPYSETWADGDILWIDPVTTGGLTNVEPLSTTVMAQFVAFVVYANATVGELMVRVSGQDEHEPLIHTVLKTGSTMTGTLGVPTVDFGDWTVTESGGSLYFATLGVNKMKLYASGNLEIVGNITELATIT